MFAPQKGPCDNERILEQCLMDLEDKLLFFIYSEKRVEVKKEKSLHSNQVQSSSDLSMYREKEFKKSTQCSTCHTGNGD
jgi:hypothetical protein